MSEHILSDERIAEMRDRARSYVKKTQSLCKHATLGRRTSCCGDSWKCAKLGKPVVAKFCPGKDCYEPQEVKA